MRLTPIRMIARNALEFAVIFGAWWAILEVIDSGRLAAPWVVATILIVAWAKTLFFGAENIRQLWHATAQNTPYHKFMLLMLVNMWQIMTSFALDFHLLDVLRRESFAGVNESLAGAALVFEFFYFSALNFMFFGYGDITPQSIPAKLLTLTEITLAFVTVIFLLSDFISLKDSLRHGAPRDESLLKR
ncbi:ion channel [Lacipirellula parvula]|uniref:Potassium channel domain-containing protein n=1 Tax=Lacipirellula parvula TaxID=2650471 RepID=A0A5K7XDS2_9BACT|nr:ion channel [Lacipirellula parvula]BBO32486.1 hypothetical protein PLANPX_2098 [Lacipirellula parvula]